MSQAYVEPVNWICSSSFTQICPFGSQPFLHCQRQTSRVVLDFGEAKCLRTIVVKLKGTILSKLFSQKLRNWDLKDKRDKLELISGQLDSNMNTSSGGGHPGEKGMDLVQSLYTWLHRMYIYSISFNHIYSLTRKMLKSLFYNKKSVVLKGLAMSPRSPS